jgi:CHASE3 domain sensor protein
MQAVMKAIGDATKIVMAEKDWPDMDKREALVKQMLRRRHENWAASADNTEEHNRIKQERGKRRAEAVEKRASDQQEQKRKRLEAAAAAAATAMAAAAVAAAAAMAAAGAGEQGDEAADGIAGGE